MTETSQSHLPELSSRQEQLLSLIIQSYTNTPEPVSSKYLVETYELGISSATVRNEMSHLEELGLIAAPHTSAGRIPTTLGYRYFVKNVIHSNQLSELEREHLAQKFDKLPMAVEKWMRQAATILARTAQTASLVTPPTAEIVRFKRIELIEIQGRLTLMVLVVHGGTVHQRMLNLAEPVTQNSLSTSAGRLNNLFANLSANEVRVKSVQLSTMEREIADLVVEIMEAADRSKIRVIYRDGLSEIINAFQDTEGARQAVRVFEERAFLDMILAEYMNPVIAENDVQVVIAGNGRWEEINNLSMVLSRYGVPGQLTGALGLLGPTHINYGRAITTVRYVASIMTDMLADMVLDPSQIQDSIEKPPKDSKDS